MSSYQEGMDAFDRGDYDTALKEWRPLAERGHVGAQSLLGSMYDQGKGVPQDYQEAVRWYQKAAEQGHAWAQVNLGRRYAQGQGVAQNDQEAFQWVRKAAEQGYATAEGVLGSMYYEGRWGAPQDYVLARVWLTLAAEQGSEKAAGLRDFLEEEMTLDELAEAQRLAREWTPKGE